jgi:predicted RecB family nuclease
MRLSKSRFTAGLQCHKLLWWRVHEPDAPELKPDPDLQALFDQGTQVGEAARAYVPGGVLIDLPYDRMKEKAAATRKALSNGARVVYEASFFADRVFVAVDILERRGEGVGLIEVKSSTRVKDEHLPDVAIQAHVLAASGLEVRRAEVMHLNRACVHPDLSNLFERADVTAEVQDLLPDVPARIAAQLEMLAGPLPPIPIGPHCTSPRPCPFMGRCWPERPEHHVSTLFLAGKRAQDLEAQGYVTIDQLPPALTPHPIADRQRRAVTSGRMIVEGDLARSLEVFEPPLAFLDFETVQPAIPVWNGCRPYDQVPAQFSCDRLAPDGTLVHHEWLAEGPGDPRSELAARLVEACRGARSVVAYNMTFERRGIEMVAAAAPEHRRELMAIAERLADPWPVLRDHVYHPDFGGSFSLKAVLPALVPELSYEGLEVADGTMASREIARLMFEGARLAPGEKESLRAALRAYCALDTRGLVALLERMRALAGGA